MASRKDEKETLRKAREEAEAADRRQERKRLILGYAVAGVLTAAIAAGIVVAIVSGGGDSDAPTGGGTEGFAEALGVVPDGAEFDDREGTPPPELAAGDLDSAADAANCEVQRNLEEEGNSHYSEEDREADWKTNPPTSGDHFGVPTENVSGALADGPYLNTPPLSRLIHALEHGRVAIHYSPDLPEDDQLALKGVFDADPQGLILMPNPDLDDEVAVAAWTNLATCPTYEGEATLDVVRLFISEFRGRGPEPVPLA